MAVATLGSPHTSLTFHGLNQDLFFEEKKSENEKKGATTHALHKFLSHQKRKKKKKKSSIKVSEIRGGKCQRDLKKKNTFF